MMQHRAVVEADGCCCMHSARLVAYIDIILVVLEFLVYGLFGYGYLMLTTNPQTNDPVGLFADMATWIGVALTCSIIILCIAYGLLTATDMRTPRALALRKAKRYRCFNVFFVVVYLIGATLKLYQDNMYGGMTTLFSAIARIIFIIIVHRFIERLHMSFISGTLGAVSYDTRTVPRVGVFV